jgi:hypothetical protein
MACALVMLFSMGQVDTTHSTTGRTVYAGRSPHAIRILCLRLPTSYDTLAL